MTISIGAMLGGPEVAGSTFDKVLSKAMTKSEKEPTIIVVFMVTGSIITKLEFTGLRTGSFSKAKKRLMVQVAVPSSIAVGATTKTMGAFIVASLHEAISLARPKFLKAKLGYPQSQLERTVERIGKTLGA